MYLCQPARKTTVAVKYNFLVKVLYPLFNAQRCKSMPSSHDLNSGYCRAIYMKRHTDDTLVFMITAATSVKGCEMLDKHDLLHHHTALQLEALLTRSRTVQEM